MEDKRPRWLYVGNRWYMSIPKTYGGLQLTNIGNTVTQYGQGYSIEMFSTFNEELDIGVDIKLPDAINCVTKENTLSRGILHTRHLATGSALIIQKDNYYVFDLQSRSRYGRPVNKDSTVLLDFDTHEECCICLR